MLKSKNISRAVSKSNAGIGRDDDYHGFSQRHSISVREIFLIICILFIAFFSFLIIKPYFSYLLGAMVLSFVFYPVYCKIHAKFRNDSISAGVMIVLILLVVIIPISYVASQLISQSVVVFNDVGDVNMTALDDLVSNISLMLGYDFLFEDFLVDVSHEGRKFILAAMPQIFGSLSSLFLGVFIMMFVMFYLFRDGEDIITYFLKLFPIKQENEHRLVEELGMVTRGVVYGQVAVAVVQGLLAGIGYAIFGVSAPVLWAFITLIASFLPTFGTALVWIPICLFMIVAGNYTAGVLLAIYCFVIVSSIDNVIRTKLIEEKTGLHPVLVLLGVLGGLKMFGLIGLVLGPVIIALMTILLKLYIDDYR